MVLLWWRLWVKLWYQSFIPVNGCVGRTPVHCFFQGPIMLLRRPWPKGESEAGNRGTENTMDTKKHQKKTKHWSTKIIIWTTKISLKTDNVIRPSGGVNSSCATSGTRRDFPCYKSGVRSWQRKEGLWQTENIRGHLWNRHSVAINQILYHLTFPNDKLNIHP